MCLGLYPNPARLWSSFDVTLLCKQKWGCKGLRELPILASPTYSQDSMPHIMPIILCKLKAIAEPLCARDGSFLKEEKMSLDWGDGGSG